jgi:hypothetical protein
MTPSHTNHNVSQSALTLFGSPSCCPKVEYKQKSSALTGGRFSPDHTPVNSHLSPSTTPASRLPISPVLQSTPAIQPAPHHLLHPPTPNLTIYLLKLLYSAPLLLAPADRNYALPFIHASSTLHLHKHFLPVAEVALFLVTPQFVVASNCRSTCAATDPDTLTCGITYGEAHHSHPACHTNITHSRPWSTHRVKAHHETNYFLIYFLLSAAATQFLSYHRPAT